MMGLFLASCDTIEENQKKSLLRDSKWDKAELIDVKYYKSDTDPRYLQTFEMDGYKFVIYFNDRGSAMQAIIPIDTTSHELDDYIRMLEEENQFLGSKLAEHESN